VPVAAVLEGVVAVVPVPPLVPEPEAVPPVPGALVLASTVTVPFMNGWIVQW
jgi:hypothetical protein